MIEEKILEGNKLIAEFMGLKPTEWGGMYSISQDHCTCRENTPEMALNGFASIAKYRESWDWLMPVVEKIEKTTAWVNIKGCHVTISSIVNVSKSTKIEAVWIAAVAFIKWYN